MFKKLIFCLLALTVLNFSKLLAEEGFVASIDMRMLILPGTASFLKDSIEQAHIDGAKALLVKLDTPGGILTTTQEMTQAIFDAPLPVIIYIAPTGSTATSAGVFITLSGHVAAMAPGTTIGAAHPVASDGKDIDGDMRAKAENAAAAMIKAIADQRGRNTSWAEKAVKESVSVTAKEALELGVVDIVATDIAELFTKIKGKEIKLKNSKFTFGDFSKLPIREYKLSVRDEVINFFAHPNVAAILWLVATTAISIELYNPGAIVPGVVGAIALILALSVNQVIPMSQGAMLLLIAGAGLIVIDLFVSSMVLAIGGVIAITLGALYLVDPVQAPGMQVSMSFILPIAVVVGGFFVVVAFTAAKTLKKKSTSGLESLIGQTGRAVETISRCGQVSVAGELWKAVPESGLIAKDDQVQIMGIKEGLVLVVKKI